MLKKNNQKIAVTASSNEIDSPVDPRFGRCPYLLIVDPETMEYEALDNVYAGASGGAGIQAAQRLAAEGVEALLTGSCGPNAFETLRAAGVRVIVGARGTVREAVERYLSGEGLEEASRPDAPPHYGMGKGRGYGRGYGRASLGFTKDDEIDFLKMQAEEIRRQLNRIAERIAVLERTPVKENDE